MLQPLACLLFVKLQALFEPSSLVPIVFTSTSQDIAPFVSNFQLLTHHLPLLVAMTFFRLVLSHLRLFFFTAFLLHSLLIGQECLLVLDIQ